MRLKRQVTSRTFSAAEPAAHHDRPRISVYMRNLAVAALMLAGGLFPAGSWAQSPPPHTVAVNDKSDYQNTIQYSGHISFVDQFLANQLISSCATDISARNISGKAIVLFIASLEELSPYGGCNNRNLFQFDNLFGAPIEPEATFVVSRRPSTAVRYLSVSNPLASPDEPKAEIRTVYIQFADGSTVGDQAAAADMLKTRSVILERLQQLETAFTTRGQADFATLLNAKVAGDADWYFNKIRDTAKQKGDEAAFDEVQSRLAAAKRNSP